MANLMPLSALPSTPFLLAPPDLSTGISSLPRGGITEIQGSASTGRTALAQRMLATATLGGGCLAWIDSADSFDPVSARRAGTDLAKLLWVQCGHKVET